MDFEITQEYTETARKLETKDKAHANLFNELFQKLLNNDAFMKMTADSLAEKMLEKGMIANNLVTDNTEMVLAAPMGKLLKEQLDEQNKNIDKIHHVSLANVQNKGWYRFAKKSGVTSSGGDGSGLIFLIKQYHHNGGSLSCTGILSTSSDQSNICILGNSSSSPNITKIRHTYDKNAKISYLEFYYNINSSNGIYFQIFSPKSYSGEWTLLESLEKTEDVIDSFSVLSSADLTTKNRNVVTNSDLPKLYYKIKSPQNAGNPTQAIKDNWYTIPDGSYLCEIEVGSVCTGIVQKIEDGNYGSVYIISYGLITPIYMRKELDSWFVK